MLKCEESRKRRTAYVFIQIPENVRVRFLAMIVVTKEKAGCFVLFRSVVFCVSHVRYLVQSHIICAFVHNLFQMEYPIHNMSGLTLVK